MVEIFELEKTAFTVFGETKEFSDLRLQPWEPRLEFAKLLSPLRITEF